METLNCAEKGGKEKRKKSSDKKASKPPRPPRAPSLNATDQKLMKEIAEYAMLKRARMERMKALKKEKNAKSASVSSGNAIAMLFTMIFIFIILFQGCSPSTKPSVNNFEGSPVSAGFLDKDSISAHYGPISELRQQTFIWHTKLNEASGLSKGYRTSGKWHSSDETL